MQAAKTVTITTRGPSTLRAATSALQHYYAHGLLLRQRDAAPMPAKLKDDPLFSMVSRNFATMGRAQRGERPAGRDPQYAAPSNSSLDVNEMFQLADALLRNPYDTATRDLSLILFQAGSCGRGDESRNRLLTELMEPLPRSSIGECACFN